MSNAILESSENVVEAAQRRIAMLFDLFNRIVVSVSGGKDSHVLFALVAAEATKRGRKFEAFFLDQEAEYQGTVDVIDEMMRHPAVIPVWVQVPIRMTNATSSRAIWLNAWGEGEKWMRDKSDLAIHSMPGAPDRFYDFFPWHEGQATEPTAFIIGLRSRESLNRWRAVAKSPGMPGIPWSSKCSHPDSFRFYPIFDWAGGDVWKYLSDERLKYNRIYDRMYALGVPEKSLRVSFLIHEQSYRSMITLQELEPETYERLVARIEGVHCAGIYAAEDHVYMARKLPDAFRTWREYRDYLVATTPLPNMARFVKRMEKQGSDEATCKEHVRQLLINDWENNVPMRRTNPTALKERWWHRL